MNYLILELEIFKIPACPAVSVRYCEYLADILSTLVDFLKIPLDFFGIIILDSLLFVDAGSFSSS